MTTLSPWVYSVKYQAYKWVSAVAIRRAKKIIVPAQTIKETILTHVKGIRADKIEITYEGVDAAWFGKPIVHDPKSRALFYTGSLYPHKNVMLVVRALRSLPGFHLYISSARNVFVDSFMTQVKSMGLQSRVTYLGRLSDQELREWYGKSFALVQPSFSEGFGLTGVEAMAAGVPILASDIPIFSEIYQDCFTKFEPMYPESFVAAVRKLERTPRSEQVRKGIALAHQYEWKKMVDKTIRLYQSVSSV